MSSKTEAPWQSKELQPQGLISAVRSSSASCTDWVWPPGGAAILEKPCRILWVHRGQRLETCIGKLPRLDLSWESLQAHKRVPKPLPTCLNLPSSFGVWEPGPTLFRLPTVVAGMTLTECRRAAEQKMLSCMASFHSIVLEAHCVLVWTSSLGEVPTAVLISVHTHWC